MLLLLKTKVAIGEAFESDGKTLVQTLEYTPLLSLMRGVSNVVAIN
jgi:hypothetical protein